MKIITTSWDDGFRKSLWLGNILEELGMGATFYIPVNAVKKGKIWNLEHGETFLNEEELKTLNNNFEIGAHGVTHKYLTEIPSKKAEKEIKDSKRGLEKTLNEEIHGIAYPGGKFNQNIIKHVKKFGYNYARTVKDGKLKIIDRFKIPVSIFCYNSLISRGKFSFLAAFSKVYAFGGDWRKCILKGYKHMKKDGGILHIAGHSQDLSDPQFRKKLKKTLFEVSGDPEIEYLTNAATIRRLQNKGI